MKKFAIVFITSLFLISCKDKVEPIVYGNLEVQIKHTFNGKTFKLTTDTVQNSLGQKILFRKFLYYLSNFQLSDGKNTIEIPESYKLVYLSDSDSIFKFQFKNVPIGNYTNFKFYFGVDEKANKSTDQVGDLDPNNNMAWSWFTGYKFLLTEGSYFTPKKANGFLAYHIGTNECYKEISLPYNSNNSIFIQEGQTTIVQMENKVEKLFSAVHTIDIDSIYNVEFGSKALLIADNFQQVFITK